MKHFIISSILLLTLQCATAQTDSVRYLPDYSPDRIMLTISGNPASERSVTWRTRYDITNGFGQIAKATATVTPDTILTIKGSHAPWEKGSMYAMGHKVTFKDLIPNTQYMYRVGDSASWSEWFLFTTASQESNPFSIIYFGDMQNGIKSHCSRTVRQAYAHKPNASFMLFAGDLVNRSYEEYWREFFYAGSFIFASLPSVATPGNHEYYPNPDTTLPRTFSRHWNSIYNNPDNGPVSNRNNSYHFIYQDVKFISIDSYFFMEIAEDQNAYLTWLEDVLKKQNTRWSVVFFHHPVYSCSHKRNNADMQTKLKPLFEKYDVDLVLQGHDHTYCRGQNITYSSKEGKRSPMYVVSVAGSKMYGLSTEKWSDRVSSTMQLYQLIDFSHTNLKFNTYLVTGELYDSFEIEKDNHGDKTISIDPAIELINESVDIPQSYIDRYTPEEIESYKKIYQQE